MKGSDLATLWTLEKCSILINSGTLIFAKAGKLALPILATPWMPTSIFAKAGYVEETC